MNKEHKTLVILLSWAIRGQNPNTEFDGQVDWREVFEEAKAHDVYALLYPILGFLEDAQGFDKAFLKEWQKAALLAGALQLQNAQAVSEVLDAFNRGNIPVIALKGLVLREFYSFPELRTMVDADLMVREEDIERSKETLIRLNYFLGEVDEKHIQLSHETNLTIELHRVLFNPHMKNYDEFTRYAWNKAFSSKVCSSTALVLPDIEMLVYMLMHLADHMKSYGFGLRQLCDVVVFVEAKYDSMDWTKFYEMTLAYGIDKFAKAIFAVCKKLFDMEIPSVLPSDGLEEDIFLERLISDILTGGVHGHRGTYRELGNSILLYSDDADKSSGFNSFISFLFPSVKKLREVYSYAKRYPALLPIAWGQRIVKNLWHRGIADSLRAAFSIKSREVFDERDALIKWLKLR